MESPRRITKILDVKYIKEIIELAENIKVNSESLLVDYENIFEEEEKKIINKNISKLEEYIKLLKGYGELLIKSKCHSSIHRKFKIIAQEIFEIELLLKKYSIKVWKSELTSVDKFNNSNNYCYLVYSLLMDPNLKYIDNEQTLQEQYEERMDRLKDNKRRFLSTSLVMNDLTKLFYDSHIATIVELDELNYIGACYKDAATGDSMFTKECISKGIYNDIYTLRRDEIGNIYTGEPATIVSTPKIIKYKQLYDERVVTVSEIIIDRMKTQTKGILCYIYGNKFLSYSRKFAKRLGEKYNLNVVYVDKMLYKGTNIKEYELYEQFEIIDGIKQYLDKKTKEKIEFLSSYNFDKIKRIYLKIFESAYRKEIYNEEDVKCMIQNIANKVILDKEIER